MTDRNPFITKRPAAFDRKYGNGRTAEIGAGDQCVILSVDSFSDENDREGAKVDLSFADEDAPLRVCLDLSNVPVPSHYFDHLVEAEKSGKSRLPTAEQCAEFVGEARRLLDTDDLDAEVINEMLIEHLSSMHITI